MISTTIGYVGINNSRQMLKKNSDSNNDNGVGMSAQTAQQSQLGTSQSITKAPSSKCYSLCRVRGVCADPLLLLLATWTVAPAPMKTVMTSDSRSFSRPRAMLPPNVAALLTCVPVCQTQAKLTVCRSTRTYAVMCMAQAYGFLLPVQLDAAQQQKQLLHVLQAVREQ